MLSSDAEVNDELLLRILERGHSRLPVYEGENKQVSTGDQQNNAGLVLMKGAACRGCYCVHLSVH